MNDMVKRFRAGIEVCMREPEEFAKLLREEPDDKIVGEFIGLSVIYAAFGLADFMSYADKADGYESVSELTKFLEETKELRRSEDWKQAQREYVELICQLGDILLEEQEDTGGGVTTRYSFLSGTRAIHKHLNEPVGIPAGGTKDERS